MPNTTHAPHFIKLGKAHFAKVLLAPNQLTSCGTPEQYLNTAQSVPRWRTDFALKCVGCVNLCGSVVDWVEEKLRKLPDFYTLSTVLVFMLGDCTTFVHKQITTFEQFLSNYSLAFGWLNNLITVNLYTLSTVPTNTTKLNKG